jgi:hypothetical protein
LAIYPTFKGRQSMGENKAPNMVELEPVICGKYSTKVKVTG